MSVTIILTDEIRKLPYFSDFQENRIEVPNKPFIKELLDNTVSFDSLPVDDLVKCIETCVYFSLETKTIIEELLWKIGEHKDIFQEWFVADNIEEETWIFNPKLSFIRNELIRVVNSSFNSARLTQLGIRWIKPDCNNIAAGGNLRLLKWAHEHKSSWDIYICYSAAENGHLDCLKYAHEQGCPWDRFVCDRAAYHGQLECLKYAHEHGCPWDTLVYIEAIKGGHVDCVKYAHEQGCPWSGLISSIAAGYGQLECLKYAHEHGCGWNISAWNNAAEYGHLDCLKYLYEHGCSWDDTVIDSALKGGYSDCIKYIQDKLW